MLPVDENEDRLLARLETMLNTTEVLFVVSPGEGWEHATFLQDETEDLFRDLQLSTLQPDSEGDD
jgi:hypothetical protein